MLGLRPPVRALICGAGTAGLTLARLLDAMGWYVDLVERAARLREEGYLIDFFGLGFDVAESIGLLPRLREKAYTVTEVNYVDQFGRPRATLNYQRMVRSLTAACSACCVAIWPAHFMKASANECGNTTAVPCVPLTRTSIG
jgi:2-polyprenyl-6-methoxyphenol hydroxylase-like FAD-dependent oxidoreductase